VITTLSQTEARVSSFGRVFDGINGYLKWSYG
jgi:hypothetical protein